ncbi:MAG: metallophosphoesterase [Endomicrobium sp.]|jgi:Icc-related predicted phosphoesterase|nr:metallophosphoesterase [Endomicrobium sp.]
MKILAVSDIEDNRLYHIIKHNREKLNSINYIFSCGDLPRKYLEYLTDSIKKSLYFVSGNHYIFQFYGDNFNSQQIIKKLYYGKGMRLRLGGIDMHGRVEFLENYIVVGFGGSMKYNPGNFQFEEFEMERIVRRVKAEIRWQRIKEFFFLKKRKEVIVMSHAPVAGIHDKEDRCHQGFKCFRDFIHTVKPILWMHGHIHYEGQKKEQNTFVEKTLVSNIYSSKVIDIFNNEVKVSQVYDL